MVARSSTEAEYRVMENCNCEIIWFIALLKDFGINQIDVVVMYCHNQFAISLLKNPVQHERTKHVELDCHFIREKVAEGIIETQYVHTSLQLANLFTKALPKPGFYNLLRKMSICNIHFKNAHLEGECYKLKDQSLVAAVSHLTIRQVA